MTIKERARKLLKSNQFRLIAVLIPFLGVSVACQFFTDSIETGADLDREGKNAEAIQAYQDYLKNHPNTSQAPRIYYRLAKNYEAKSDYANAQLWYGMILSQYPKTDEAMHSLLDMAVLYRDKLKNPAKALEYDQKAFTQYMDNAPLRNAIQPLIDVQYQTALASFVARDYKKTAETAENIFQVYPIALMLPDTHTRVQNLIDRAHRAQSVADASVDSITLSNETLFNKNDEVEFAPDNPDEKNIPSPDGKLIAARKKGSDDKYYVYLAKAPQKGNKPSFKRLGKTSGAYEPAWSPDGKELVYCRIVSKQRQLEQLDVKTMATQILFLTKSTNLGIHPAYHPAGNKIAYVYEGRICLINAGDKTPVIFDGLSSSGNTSDAYFKQLLKTKQKLDYTAELQWSTDGTMIRFRQTDKKGKLLDELLFLDVTTSNNL
jgi:hypothetical protein